MKTIRNATFETNSSSTHALVILSKQEYEDFCNDIEKANDFKNFFKYAKEIKELPPIPKNFDTKHLQDFINELRGDIW